MLGDPYSDEDIAGAPAALQGKTELDALVAYLQGLGRHAPRSAAATPADDSGAAP
jgi:cytochrome c oxidase cbb3-type subunit 2